MSAARRNGKWIGGHPVLGCDIDTEGGRIVVNPVEAEQVRAIFDLYIAEGSTLPVLMRKAFNLRQRGALVAPDRLGRMRG